MSMPASANLGEHLFAVAAVRGENVVDLTVVGEGV